MLMYVFEKEPDRLVVTRWPGFYGAKTFVHVGVRCGCCGEDKAIGSVTRLTRKDEPARWTAKVKDKPWGAGKTLTRRRKAVVFGTVNEAVAAILAEKGLPPMMWRA
jgi:DMSO/TMAO reductase YedYZ molybdopterin-dependent catalytic subunit